MGQFGWVSVFRKIAFALRSLKAATQCTFGRRPPRCHFLPNGRISARQRALNHEASCWNRRVIRHPSRARNISSTTSLAFGAARALQSVTQLHYVDSSHVPMLSNPKLDRRDPYRRKRLTSAIFTQQGVELEQPA
jgi:hypothetical protein